MTDRQDKILKALIREFVKTAEPVASELLKERYKLPYSSATVRAELSALELEGYLMQPHTSAGRVPTDLGYRYFVNQTVVQDDVSETEVSRLRDDFLGLQNQHNKLARYTAKMLAALSQNLAVAGLIQNDELHEAGLTEMIKEPEFAEAEYLTDVSRVLDVLENDFETLMAKVGNIPEIYIGEENPYARVSRLSVILACCDLPSGERGLLAIIGPTRMKYERNVKLLRAFTAALENNPKTYE